jgi:hypothetical protein
MFRRVPEIEAARHIEMFCADSGLNAVREPVRQGKSYTMVPGCTSHVWGTELSVLSKHLAAKLSARHHHLRLTVLSEIAAAGRFDVPCPFFGLCDLVRYALSYKAMLRTSAARYRMLFSRK